MTLVIITGEIDLSVASMVGLSSVVFGILHQGGLPIPLAAIVALVVGVVGGAINGLLVTVVGLPSLAVTTAAGRSTAAWPSDCSARQQSPTPPETRTQLAKQRIGETGIPLVIILFVVLAAVFAVVLHFTPFGRGIYAIGLSPEAALFSGIKVNRTKLILFVLAWPDLRAGRDLLHAPLRQLPR